MYILGSGNRTAVFNIQEPIVYIGLGLPEHEFRCVSASGNNTSFVQNIDFNYGKPSGDMNYSMWLLCNGEFMPIL
jgi:hypothetical protein